MRPSGIERLPIARTVPAKGARAHFVEHSPPKSPATTRKITSGSMGHTLEIGWRDFTTNDVPWIIAHHFYRRTI